MLSALNVFARKTFETDSIGNYNRDLQRKETGREGIATAKDSRESNVRENNKGKGNLLMIFLSIFPRLSLNNKKRKDKE